MSDLEMSVPTREDLQAELGDLRAERAIGQQLLDAARARSDQDAEALREVATDRDRWQSAAENLRAELWRQVDELRAESAQHRDQIAQLSVSFAALLEAIVGTTPTAQVVESAAAAWAAESPAPTLADRADPGPVDTAVLGEVAPPALPSTPDPPVVLAPHVPANEPPRPGAVEPAATELAPLPPERDRVGLLTELAAVAVDSVVPTANAGSAADCAGATDDAPSTPNGMDILPAAALQPARRQRLPRLPRLPS